MKPIIQILLLSLIPSLLYAQNTPVPLNFKKQSFSVNSINLEEQKIYASNDFNIEIYVDTNTVSILYFRSHLFPLEYDDSGEEMLGHKVIQVYKLTICNDSLLTRSIQTEDSRFVLVQEALDTSGVWIPIEHFRHSSCGQSYSVIELPNNFCTDGLIAKYEGEFKTKLRVKMLFNGMVIYSNEYYGSINRGQLKHKNPKQYNLF